MTKNYQSQEHACNQVYLQNLHQLIGTIERYIILTGKGIVEVEGLEAQEVQANDVVIIPPDCSQKITNRSTSDLIFLAVCTPRFKTDCYRDI